MTYPSHAEQLPAPARIEDWTGENGAFTTLAMLQMPGDREYVRGSNLSGFRQAVSELSELTGIQRPLDERRPSAPVVLVTSDKDGTIEFFDGRNGQRGKWYGLQKSPDGSYRVTAQEGLKKDSVVAIGDGDVVLFGIASNNADSGPETPDLPLHELFRHVTTATTPHRRRFLGRLAVLPRGVMQVFS